MQRDKELSAAILAQEQTRLQIAEKRIAIAAQIARGGIGLQTARFALGQNTFSQNDKTRFQAGQAVEKNQSLAQVATAASRHALR